MVSPPPSDQNEPESMDVSVSESMDARRDVSQRMSNWTRASSPSNETLDATCCARTGADEGTRASDTRVAHASSAGLKDTMEEAKTRRQQRGAGASLQSHRIRQGNRREEFGLDFRAGAALLHLGGVPFKLRESPADSR